MVEEVGGGGKAGAEGVGDCPSHVSESCAPESEARESADGMRKRLWKHEIGGVRLSDAARKNAGKGCFHTFPLKIALEKGAPSSL